MIFNWYDNGIALPYSTDHPDSPVQIHSPQNIQDGSDDQTPKSVIPLRRRQKAAAEAYESTAHTPTEKALVASQIMSSPVQTLTEATSLADAYRWLSEKKIKHAPVVNAEGRLSGIVSEPDLLHATSFLNVESVPTAAALKTVASIMRHPVLTAKPATPLPVIARILFHERLGSLCIVDERETLVGILTLNDILRAVMEHPSLQGFV